MNRKNLPLSTCHQEQIKIIKDYQQSFHRLFSDYDGTLVPYHYNLTGRPINRCAGCYQLLCQDAKTELLLSVAEKNILEKWFKGVL